MGSIRFSGRVARDAVGQSLNGSPEGGGSTARSERWTSSSTTRRTGATSRPDADAAAGGGGSTARRDCDLPCGLQPLEHHHRQIAGTRRSRASSTVPPERDDTPARRIGPAGRRDACTQAFAKADAALSRAVHLDRELAAHTKVLDDLLAKRTDAAGVLHQSLPILTEATTDRLRFAEERTAYQDARKGCTAAGG